MLIKGETFPIRLALQTKLDVVTLTQSTLDALGIDPARLDDVKGLHLIDVVAKHQPGDLGPGPGRRPASPAAAALLDRLEPRCPPRRGPPDRGGRAATT